MAGFGDKCQGIFPDTVRLPRGPGCCHRHHEGSDTILAGVANRRGGWYRFFIMLPRLSGRGRFVSAILVTAFLIPALTGWAGDNCCPDRGPALPGLERPVATGLTADEQNDAGPGPEPVPTPCSCSLCQPLIARMGVPGIESPAALDGVSALPGEIYASRDFSEIFRPPLA